MADDFVKKMADQQRKRQQNGGSTGAAGADDFVREMARKQKARNERNKVGTSAVNSAMEAIGDRAVLDFIEKSFQPTIQTPAQQKQQAQERMVPMPTAFTGTEVNNRLKAGLNDMPLAMQGERSEEAKVEKALMDMGAAEQKAKQLELQVQQAEQLGAQIMERQSKMEQTYGNLMQLKQAYETTGDLTTGRAYLIAVEQYNADVEAFNKDYAEYQKTAKVYDSYNQAVQDVKKKQLDYDAAYSKLQTKLQNDQKKAEEQQTEKAGFWKTAYDQIGAGAGQFNKLIAQTVRLVAEAPMEVEELLSGSRAFTGSLLQPVLDWADWVIRTADAVKMQADQEAAAYGTAGNVAGQLTQGVIAALPSSLAAMLTGGGSLLTQLPAQTAGLAETARQAVLQMMQNPSYWFSALQTLGSSYEEALASGGTEAEALIAAVLNTLAGSAVEVSGGMEQLPKELQGADLSNGKRAWQWLKSGLEEGGEELIQNPLQRLINKTVSQSNVPYFSMTDPNAVLNPITSAQEFGSGAAVGLILGGGQTMLDVLLNGRNNKTIESAETTEEAVKNLQTAYQNLQATGSEADAAEVIEASRVLQEVAAREGKTAPATAEIGNDAEEQTEEAPAEPRNEKAEGIQWAGSTPEIETERVVTNERTKQQAELGQSGNRAGKPGSDYRDAGQNPKRTAARAAIRRAEEARRVQTNVQALGGELTSLREQGLSMGSDDRVLTTVRQEAWTPEVESAWEIADSEGLEFVPLLGNMQAVVNGKTTQICAAIQNGKIYARADSTRQSIREAVLHEVFHEKAKQDPGLVERVAEKIRQTYTREETQAMFERYADLYQNNFAGLTDEELENAIWEEMLADAYAEFQRYSDSFGTSEWNANVAAEVWNKEGKTGSTGSGQTKFSFAGENARTANLQEKARAQQKEQDGATPEEILKETGWFRGMDKKWRFEIDDSNMQYHRRGDAEFRKDHPDYDRYRTLVRKQEDFMLGEIGSEPLTAEEQEEMKNLRQIWGDVFRKEGKVSEDARTKTRLADYLEHDELFAAYPQLKDTRLVFTEMDSGVLASYDKYDDVIRVREKLKRAPEKELIHEIQHAVQAAENFAGGSNEAYWRRKKERGFSLREFERKRIEAAEEYQKIWDSAPEEFREKVRELRAAMRNEDWDTAMILEDNIFAGEYGDLYSRLNEADFDRRGDLGEELSAFDLYWNTAGEIEARDAANRRDMTEDQRRENLPDLGDENVVFAETGAQWSAASEYDEEKATIKQQIENSAEQLNQMDVVANLAVPKNLKTKDEAATWAADILKNTGYQVDRQGYGKIYFSKKDMDRGLRYADTPEEKAALAALPRVLKRGIEVGAHDDHKKRSKQTFTIAAPVKLNGIRGNMAVVVNKNGGHYYAHRLVLPDGRAFRFSDQTENTAQELSRGVTVSGSLADTTSAAFTDSLQDRSGEVKAKFSISEEGKRDIRKELQDKIKPGLISGVHAVPRTETEVTGHIARPEGMSDEEYAELDAKWQERHSGNRNGQEQTPVEDLIIPKTDFMSTPAMDKLGIKIDGSVTRYRQTEQLRAYEKAARQAQKILRKRIKDLKPSGQDLYLARGIVDGNVTASALDDDRLNVGVITEIADYMMASRSFSEDMIAQRRSEINTANLRIAETMFADAEAYNPKLKFLPGMTKMVMNERTPERVVKQIFGKEQGQKIYETYFRPVWVNGAEMYRFENRMLERVEKFEDQSGVVRAMTEAERAMAQRLMEGEAARENVERLEADARERVESAAKNVNNGEEFADAVREFNLQDEYHQGLVQAYADYLDAVTMSEDMDRTIMANAIKEYQQIYNEMYDAINDFLVSHGYTEIGFIKGYAPHFQKRDAQQGLFGALKALGVEKEGVSELPASIAGRTADFKPNMKWNPHMQGRKGSQTSYDIQEGFEQYLHYAAEMFYHTDDVMRVRQAVNWFRGQYSGEEISVLIDDAQVDRYKSAEWKQEFLEKKGLLQPGAMLDGKAINKLYDQYVSDLYERAKPENLQKYSEFVTWLDNYANIVAGKQSLADRSIEYGGGRNILNVGSKMMRAFSAANVGGNLSSVLNQSAQLPLIQKQLGKYLERAAADMARGGIAKDNFVERSDFLTDKRGVEKLTTNTAEKIISALFKPAELMDRLVSTMAVRGRYLQALSEGMTMEDAMKAADDFGRRVMGSRMKGAKPLGFESKTFVNQMLHVFQVEAANTFDYMLLSDIPQAVQEIKKEKGKAAASRYVAAFATSYLMNAFVLNQITGALYGGSPAPFDLVGWALQFVAGGFGRTDEEFLKTLIDNVWERMFGERPFETEPVALKEGVHWAGAFDDLKYNVSNDIPYMSNIAGLLGWGDQTLPTVGVNEMFENMGSAGKTLLRQIIQGEEETGISWAGALGSAGEDLLSTIAMVVPGGRQIKKTVQGVAAVAQGGRYKGDRLQYPIDRTVWNAIQAGLFGVSALDAADAFYAAELSALTAGQTAKVKELEDLGIDRFTTYDLFQQFREIGKELTGAEASTAKRNAINNLDLSDQEKLEIYSQFILDPTAETYEKNRGLFQAMLDSGLIWDDVTEANNLHAMLNEDEVMNATEKATEFAKWIDQQGWSEEQKTAAEEKFKFWNMMPAVAANYEKMEQAGVEAEKAADLANMLGDLEPEDGKETVTTSQKVLAIDDRTDLTDAEKVSAISAMVPEKRERLVEAGVSAASAKKIAAELIRAEARNGDEELNWLDKAQLVLKHSDGDKECLAALSTVLQESSYQKAELADSYGVPAEIWVDFRTEWQETYGEDSMSQEKVENVLDGMKLTNSQKAVLWQISNKSWKPKNNPYDVWIGEEIYDELNEE